MVPVQVENFTVTFSFTTSLALRVKLFSSARVSINEHNVAVRMLNLFTTRTEALTIYFNVDILHVQLE